MLPYDFVMYCPNCGDNRYYLDNLDNTWDTEDGWIMKCPNCGYEE